MSSIIITIVIVCIISSAFNDGGSGRSGLSHLWSLGYVVTTSESLISQQSLMSFIPGKIIPTIILANLPQFIFSLMYLNYNALFTCLLLAREGSGFAQTPKPSSIPSTRTTALDLLAPATILMQYSAHARILALPLTHLSRLFPRSNRDDK